MVVAKVSYGPAAPTRPGNPGRDGSVKRELEATAELKRPLAGRKAMMAVLELEVGLGLHWQSEARIRA